MSFQFELVITEKCNLKCEYCYMKNQSSNMTKEVFDAHYDFLPEIMKTYNEERFTTTFFGGEPLLNWDLIEYILPIVANDPKCEHIILPTNALKLSYYMISDLEKYNVEISLSFDGLWAQDAHIETLRLWKDQLNLNPKCMISPNRNQTIKGNYMWFVEGFETPNPDFTIVRDKIWSKTDITKFKREIRDLAIQVVKYNKEGIQTLPGPFSLYILDMLVGKKHGKRPFGCFAGHSGGGFMPDGLVYPCARFGSHKKLWLFDSIKKKEQDVNLTNNLLMVQNPKKFPRCQKCELYEYCNAGCLYSELGEIDWLSEPVWDWECDAIPEVCELLKTCYLWAFWIVDELKDNEPFQDLLKNMARRI